MRIKKEEAKKSGSVPGKSKPLGMWQLTKDAFGFYRKNFFLLFLPALLMQAFIFTSIILEKKFNEDATALGIRLLLIIGNILVSNAMFIAILERLKKKRASFADSFQTAGYGFWRYLVFAVMYGLISNIGILLLVLPGIYWGIIYGFVPAAAIFENDAINPFAMSKRLTKGIFWEILLYLVIAGFACITGFVCIVVLEKHIFMPVLLSFKTILSFMPILLLGMLAIPLFMTVYVMTYEKLKKIKKKQLSGKPAKKGLAGIGTGTGCLVNIGLIIVLGFLSYFVMNIIKDVFHYDLGKDRESRENRESGAYSNEAAAVTTASKNAIDGAIRIKWGKKPPERMAGYNFYVSKESGKGYEKVNRTPISGIEYTVTGLDVGVKYYFVLTSVTKDVPPIESRFSKEWSDIAKPAPAAGKEP